MTNSMTNYQTTFEATQNLVKTIELGHGENADLVASFTDNGVPVGLSGYTARAIYQPKSEWGTDNWFECPCDISNNTAIAHWGNTYDNGDNAVKLFMHLSKDGKVAYPAIYRIGLFATPGFTPGSIVPIQKTLDFSEYNLVNAPWVETEDYTSDIAGIRSDISVLETDSVKSIEYTGTDKLIVKQFLQANPNAVVIWKAGGLGDMTQNIFSKTGDDGEYWTYSCFDASTNQWAWFKLYTDWEISLDFILHKSDVPTIGDSTLSTTYSATPRFSEWVPVNYIFTVEWKENLNHWIFNFNGTEVGDSTGEWANPNATSLSFNYNGIQLEANRTRLDVGYVLGSQTDKPLQPMGDYATNSQVDEIRNDLEIIASKVPYQLRKIVVPQTPNVNVTVDVETNELVGIQCDEGTTPVIGINPPVQVEGQAIEFIVDIDNRTSNNIRTVINWSENWILVLEEGEALSTYNYAEAEKITRLIFKQIGVPGFNRPRLYLSRKVLFSV